MIQTARCGCRFETTPSSESAPTILEGLSAAIAATALSAATLLASPQIMGGGIFSFLSPAPTSLVAFGASGYIPIVVYGRWWTVLTATWLHASLIHIIMNMMSIRNVAPIVAEFY